MAFSFVPFVFLCVSKGYSRQKRESRKMSGSFAENIKKFSLKDKDVLAKRHVCFNKKTRIFLGKDTYLLVKRHVSFDQKMSMFLGKDEEVFAKTSRHFVALCLMGVEARPGRIVNCLEENRDISPLQS